MPYIAQANAALARYDGLLQSIINPDVLLSPLMTQEAVLSSRIEGTEATLEEVLEFEAKPFEEDTPRYEDIREIINYRQAMRMADEQLTKRPISLNLIRDIHGSRILSKLREAGILRVLREASGSKPAIWIFAELLMIAEGRSPRLPG